MFGAQGGNVTSWFSGLFGSVMLLIAFLHRLIFSAMII